METNSVGLARLFIYLANIKSFPTSLKAASIVSSVPEEVIIDHLRYSSYEVLDGKVYYKEVKKVG